jgi:hypothetical protein
MTSADPHALGRAEPASTPDGSEGGPDIDTTSVKAEREAAI